MNKYINKLKLCLLMLMLNMTAAVAAYNDDVMIITVMRREREWVSDWVREGVNAVYNMKWN